MTTDAREMPAVIISEKEKAEAMEKIRRDVAWWLEQHPEEKQEATDAT